MCSTSFFVRTTALILLVMPCFGACSSTAIPSTDKSGDTAVARPDASAIAVYPIYNLTGDAGAEEVITCHLARSLEKFNIPTIPETDVERFIRTYRVRDIGGIDAELARQLHAATRASAVLITTLELYTAEPPVRIAATSRLVSLGEDPEIVWMNGVSRAGNDSRGFLDLGLIEDPDRLAGLVTDPIAKSIGRYLQGKQKPRRLKKKGKRFLPKMFYKSAVWKDEQLQRVAVVPFFNASATKDAGEIVSLQFIQQCLATETLRPIEPGMIRHALLGLRVMMEDGISLANADIVLDRLDADALITGTVLEYEDPLSGSGVPSVGFSTFVVDRDHHQIVWSSKSFGRGDDGVRLFDFGTKYTAQSVASIMVSNVLAVMTREEQKAQMVLSPEKSNPRQTLKMADSPKK